jgi:hypothetical protein
MGVSRHYNRRAKILRRTSNFFIASGDIGGIERLTQGDPFIDMLQHCAA